MTIGTSGMGIEPSKKASRTARRTKSQRKWRSRFSIAGGFGHQGGSSHPAEPGPSWILLLDFGSRRRGGGHSRDRSGPLLGSGDPTHDFIDESIFLGRMGGQVAITLGVPGDPLDRLAGVPRQDLVDDQPALDDLFGLNFDIRDLAADLTVRLMD